MFKKKKCERCRNKINDKYDFCPYCGKPVNQDSHENFGMLGKNDSPDEFEDFSKAIFGGFGGKMINKMFGNAMKILEKEMQKEMKQEDFKPKTNFQLFINGRKINLGGEPTPVRKEPKKIPSIKLPQNKLNKFTSLKREEPSTNLRRFSNKIVYEINVPGVKVAKDISIIKLENSIEIRAVSKNKAYLKIIPINLPIINYALENQKIILELAVQG